MRTSHAATALAAFTAGLTAAATLRRLAGHRRPASRSVVTAADPVVVPSADRDAVVLAFPHRAAAPESVESAVRCGDSGGRTKAGAPCGARITAGGRCHHHRMAA